MSNAEQNARIVEPIKADLVRQKAFILAAAESVTDPKVAEDLRALAMGIEDCIHDHLDHGALYLIREAGEAEREAAALERPAQRGILIGSGRF